MIDTEKKLERARQELFMLQEVSNAIHTALRMNDTLYVVLSAVTSSVGLGFDRAMLFLVNERLNIIEGKMALEKRKGSDRIWAQLSKSQKNSTKFISSKGSRLSRNSSSKLSRLIRKTRLPLREDAGIIPMAVLEGMPLEITTDAARAKIKDKLIEELNLNYFVVVPLRGKKKSIGVIIADNIHTRNPILKEDVKIFSMFADQAGLAIENSRLYERTAILSQQDSLTRLWNHGHFQYLLQDLAKKAQRKKETLSLIMLDIDYFKNYNDTLGHQAGDEVLKRISGIIRRNIREKDIAARYGGEEFSIILPATDKDEALRIAERLRKAVEDIQFPQEETQPGGRLTISVGVATLSGEAIDKNRLLYAADSLLYKAKRGGRNKTC